MVLDGHDGPGRNRFRRNDFAHGLRMGEEFPYGMTGLLALRRPGCAERENVLAVMALLALVLCLSLTGCGSASGAAPPTVSSISPTSAPAGALAFTLTVNGSNFLSSSMVEWGGSSRATTFVSSGRLQAQISSADLSAPGKIAVTVVNPSPGGGASGSATFTVAVDTIAFESRRALNGTDNANTSFNIWVMNADGSSAQALTQLTANGADSLHPVWSPDGSKIVFSSTRALDGSNNPNQPGATPNIWVMNADGTSARALTQLTANSASSLEPVWSPDGSKIAFLSTRALDGSNNANTNFTSNIWVMNADGTSAKALTQLTADHAGSLQPVWSPDGSKIAFASSRALDGSNNAIANLTSNIWVMNADGSGSQALTELTVLQVQNSLPVWSPDGSKIAFASSRALDGSNNANTNFTSNIWVMNADGTSARALTQLTASRVDSLEPLWSPDGSKIVFTSSRALDGSNNANTNLTFNIWAMNSDGSSQQPFTQLTASGSSSDSPNQP